MPAILRDNGTYVNTILLNYAIYSLAYSYYTLLMLISLWLILANGFVLYIFFKFPQLRTLTNAPIINIAITDFFIGLIQLASEQFYFREWITIESEKMFCLVKESLYVSTNIASGQALVFAVLERYVNYYKVNINTCFTTIFYKDKR